MVNSLDFVATAQKEVNIKSKLWHLLIGSSAKDILVRLYPKPTRRQQFGTVMNYFKKCVTLIIIITFNNQWSDIKGILSRHWDILRSDPCLEQLLPSTPLFTTRRAPNFGD